MKREQEEQIRKSLEERAERIQRAGTPGMTQQAEEARRTGEQLRQRVKVDQSRTIQEAQRKTRNSAGKDFQSWRKVKISWKSITYTRAEFRETCISFDNDKNLSRFVWRTAKINGMDEVTLSDVQKMLDAADETIWVLGDKHDFLAEDPNRRAPTWIMNIDRKKQYAAMMRITNAGWATTELRDITVQGEQRQQRVWTLK